MALRKAPPGGGGAKRRVHFSYVPTGTGEKWEAYIAGPAAWYLCHTVGKTKPCLHEVSGGALECPACVSLKPPEEVGYLPLYREMDGRPVFVVIHQDMREAADSLTHRMRVMIGRGTHASDGVWVRSAMGKGQWYKSTLPERMVPADIEPTLLRVWKIPVLTAWATGQAAPEIGGCMTPPETPTIKPYTPPTLPTGVSTDDMAPLAGSLAAALRRAKEREERADDQTAIDRLKLRQEE